MNTPATILGYGVLPVVIVVGGATITVLAIRAVDAILTAIAHRKLIAAIEDKQKEHSDV